MSDLCLTKRTSLALARKVVCRCMQFQSPAIQLYVGLVISCFPPSVSAEHKPGDNPFIDVFYYRYLYMSYWPLHQKPGTLLMHFSQMLGNVLISVFPYCPALLPYSPTYCNYKKIHLEKKIQISTHKYLLPNSLRLGNRQLICKSQ